MIRALVAAGLLVALGCAGLPLGEPEPERAPTLLPTGSARDMLAACEAEPIPELAWGCRIEAAAAAGREGDGGLADQICRPLQHPVWKDECHFRAGEELGRAGHTAQSLDQCGQSAKYGRFCLTHAGWGMPPDTTRDAQQWVTHAQTALPEPLQDEAADILRARWWFNRYVGTGRADPLAAQTALPEEAAHARGAWAIEVMRLTGGDIKLARAVWAGTVGPPRGEALPVERRVGRYDIGLPIPGEQALPRVRTFADARRLVGQSVDEDLTIAFLEAIYFNGTPSGDAFRPWLDDPLPRVRYTAFHYFRILPSTGVEDALRRHADDRDPVVRAHVADALAYRTWEGKGATGGTRSAPP